MTGRTISLAARPRGIVAAALVAVLTVGLLGPAAAQEARPDPTIRNPRNACPVTEVPRSRFTDIRRTTFEREIECLVWYEVTSGVTATRYAPNEGVTRGQMATFIANLIDYAAKDAGIRALPRYDNTNQFSDTANSIHNANINRLADAGVVQGGPGGRPTNQFGPNLPVTRAQMATFINGAQEYMTRSAFTSTNDFFDDDDDSIHEPNINAIAEQGVAGGTGGRNYNPLGTVTRGQMAAFIVRLLDVNVLAERITTPTQRKPNPSNQSFVFRDVPDTAPVSANATSNQGATEFQVRELGTSDVSLALFPCADVFNDKGRIGFRDTADPEGQADFSQTSSGAVIERVNGISRGSAASNYVADVTPTNGTVTFVVDSTSADCIVGVAFADTNGNDALELDAAKTPTEAFGVSSELLYQPAEADNGPFNATVRFVDKSRNVFLTSEDSYSYGSGDTFVVANGPSTFSEFNIRLSPGDTVTGTYSRTGTSSFNLNDSAPAAPTNVSASDRGGSVRVEWRVSTTPTVDAYRIRRATTETDCGETTTGAQREGAYEVVGEVTAQFRTFVDTDMVAGRYCYRVRAVDDGDESGDSAESTVVEATGAGPDRTSPRITSATRSASGSSPLTLSAGDQHRFIFDEVMDTGLDSVGSSYTVRDGDGTTVRITCRVRGADTVSATTDCTRNTEPVTISSVTYGPGRVLTVNIGTDGVEETSGGDLPMALYPLDMTAISTHWKDPVGNILDLAASPDSEIN